MTDDYEAFLASKLPQVPECGIDVEDDGIAPTLFDYQRAIVKWACKRGRAAIFAECGLGKTFMQIEWARLVTKGKALIVAPLCVAPQTIAEGRKIGVEIHDLRGNWTPRDGLNILNYEHLDKIVPSDFDTVVLDESSILKNFTGKTKRALVEMFADTTYRLACTATPAPNDHMELGNHSEFLGVLDSMVMLATYFTHDSGDTQKWRLKNHARDLFWSWVCSWAVCIDKPSDMGFSDEGYERPPVTWHEIVVDADMGDAPDGHLFPTDRLTATTLHREMRASAPARSAKAAELIESDSDAAWIVWCNTNYEADELTAAIPEAVEVRGSEPMTKKEARLNGFTNGEIKRLVTKPSIAGLGLNWQHCHKVIVAGLSYSMEQLYQAIKRTDRFGQKRPVDIYILRSPAEGDVLATVKRKLADFQEMKTAMTDAMRRTQIERQDALKRVKPSIYAEGNSWTLYHGDSCEVMPTIPDNSVGLSVFSPPFANLYVYSDAVQDLGNCDDDAEFIEHFRFIVRELHRMTIPGRISAVHCKDMPNFRWRDGTKSMRDLPGDIIRLYQASGWEFHSRVTIWKDPVTEMQRTKDHGLLYKTLRSDSSCSRQGMPDYLLVFRKWTDLGDVSRSPDPVTHTRDEFPLDQWQEWASPVWMTVDQGHVLNNYRSGRTENDERHICPLQLDVIERCVGLWSNPGDVVFSPFAGIGSEGYQAVKMGRRSIGIELKEEYCRVNAQNMEMAERKANEPTLFGGVA